MVAWLRYRLLVRPRVRRLLRDHVEALQSPYTVIDLADDARQEATAEAA